MNTQLLLAVALLAGAASSCAHSENPRTATYPSAATYYGPSAASYAPDFGNPTTSMRSRPALRLDAAANRPG
jgi:hypothetical protein